MKSHYQVLVIGGGTGGLMVAAQLKRVMPSVDMAIIEPSEKHYYQPAWTLVGAGTYKMKDTIRDEKDYIPKGVDWIKDYASTLNPDQNVVETRKSGFITYDFLVVASGLVNDYTLLPGLEEALKTDSVCSNYVDPEKTWQVLQNFKGGNAVFTQPTTPIKCGGAPQKIMYMAEEYFRKSGIRDKTQVIFATPGSVIFGVKDFAKTLNEIIRNRDIILKTFYAPRRIDPVKQEIHFEYLEPSKQTHEIPVNNKIKEFVEGSASLVMPYEMLHLAPPQTAPLFVKNSTLAHQEGPNKGWMNVDINTLQHKVYPNVFGLGDVAALPTAKTGAAIRKQAPVVVGNLIALMSKKNELDKKYEGYSSCPLVTGYSKMVLAEFKYDNVRDSDPLLSKFVDTTKEQYSMWLLKKYALPYLYWNQMLKGKM